MLDLNKVNRRYFDIKIGDLSLKVEPPKMKTMKKVLDLSNCKYEEAIEDLAEAIRLILSKNSKSYQVPIEIIEELDFDQMKMIIEEFFKWINEARKNDPN